MDPESLPLDTTLRELLRAPRGDCRAMADAREERLGTALRHPRVTPAAGKAISAVHALNELEPASVGRAIYSVSRSEPVLGFAVAEGRGLVHALTEVARIPGFPELRCIAVAQIGNLARANTRESQEASWLLKLLTDGGQGHHHCTEEPVLREDSLNELRWVTTAFLAEDRFSAERLASHGVFDGLETPEGLVIASYAALVVGLRAPIFFREQIRPRLAGANDPGFQLLVDLVN